MEILLIKGAKFLESNFGPGAECLDEGEREQHERVWKTAPVRVRTPAKQDDELEPSDSENEYDEDDTDAREANKIVEKYKTLYRPEDAPPPSCMASSHLSSLPKAMVLPDAAPGGENEEVHLFVNSADVATPRGLADGAKLNSSNQGRQSSEGDRHGGEDAVDIERQQRLREMEARAKRQQQIERQRFLLNLDPGSWEKLADDGYFQKGEDDLMAAASEEKSVRGVTDRFCMLLHALGALLDRRSYVDETGQRHLISFRSAIFLEESISARRQRQAQATVDPSEQLRMSESILLKAQSLCNYALDGGGSSMTPRDALDECIRDLQIAIQIRAEHSPGELAETRQSIGYVYYSRGSCLLEKPPEDKHLYTADAYETAEHLFKECLSHYFEALGLYHARDGPDGELTVRMECNIALVYGQLSRMSPEAYIESAEMHYLQAIKDSTRISGNTHRPTKPLNPKP